MSAKETLHRWFTTSKDLSARDIRARAGLPGRGPPPESDSLWLRHVNPGSCGACTLELTAAMQPPFDARSMGVDVVLSPREADVLAITGALGKAMVAPVERTYHAMPEPRRLLLIGDCACGRGPFASAPCVDEGARRALVEETLSAGERVVEIHGCPPAPAKILAGLLWPDEQGAQANAPDLE